MADMLETISVVKAEKKKTKQNRISMGIVKKV